MTQKNSRNQNVAQPPVARQKVHQDNVHGITLNDPYAWLRAGNWQDVMRDPSALDPEIRAYLEAENDYTRNNLRATDALQNQLYEELRGRIKENDATVPSPDGPYAYFADYVPGGQYPRILRHARGDNTASEVLLDGNLEAEGKAFWDIGASAHSPDHKTLAYATDDKGSELYTIRFRDLATGKDLPDIIADTRGDIEWANDGRTVFYTKVDANHRPLFVFKHKLGTPVENDELIYEEKDTGFYVGIEKTVSGKYIVIDAHDHQTNEVYVLDADAPTTSLTCISPRQTGLEYQISHRGDQLYVLTNSNGAEDFQICRCPITAPGQQNWTPIVAHKPGRLILEMWCTKDHLVRMERENGLPQIVIYDLNTQTEHPISFDEEAYALGMQSGYEFDTTNLRFTYSSMTTPAETYDYDMDERTRTLRKRREVPSGHEPSHYIARRLMAPTKDGETVPISVLYHRDTPLDGSAPLLLYGYGSYGMSMPASFVANRLSLVNRGFIYAIAHIRGGKEKGYRWYRDGKHTKKQNTFSDFIAAGEHLVKQGFTSRGQIVANGGSAGGMLMGVVANQAPDLFLGIIADVPFVDVLNTMLDKDLPLTPPEWPEWGNPLQSAEDFATIRAYSPYDNVVAQDYPHILALAGLTDPRVTYWEPAKWVAKLRAHNTSDNMVLLKTNMDAGHGGASGRFSQLREVALNYAFALKITCRLDAQPMV